MNPMMRRFSSTVICAVIAITAAFYLVQLPNSQAVRDVVCPGKMVGDTMVIQRCPPTQAVQALTVALRARPHDQVANLAARYLVTSQILARQLSAWDERMLILLEAALAAALVAEAIEVYWVIKRRKSAQSAAKALS
jgi:hypothetical protein